MTTAYDVPPVLLIERLKEKLQSEGKIKPPEGASFARTGVNREKAPVQKDWWYRRVAAVLRKVYLHGPVGTSRLAAEFGGRRDDGSAPYHPRRGSRSIAREAMQQLEAMGLLTKTDKKGRAVRSEEHTSELQSRSDLVCRLLLEKKKPTTTRELSRCT